LINSGVVSILLEATPPNIAEEISKKSQVPILGIGAGSKVDGQLLILHDLLGLYPNFRPKFAKNYIPSVLDTFNNKLKNQDNIYKFGRDTRRDGLYELSRLAVEEFIRECKNGQFPNSDFEYSE
jgi:ketopantoate hydroxymethyltransferase